jgi:hypothetical protein
LKDDNDDDDEIKEDEVGGICSKHEREMGNAYNILVGKPEKSSLENLCVDAKIILERILGKWSWRCR